MDKSYLLVILNVKKGWAQTWAGDIGLGRWHSNYFLISWSLITISMSLVRNMKRVTALHLPQAHLSPATFIKSTPC